MPYYKATDDSLYFLDDASFAHVLPAGCVPITNEQAAAMAPQPDPKAAIKAQVQSLLNTAGVSQTWHLDGLMAGVLALGMGQGMTEPEVYAINPGYRDIKDLRGAIALLEAQL